MIFDAALRRPRSEFIAFCFDLLPDELAERASVTPNLQALAATEAILGGVRADWVAPTEAQAELWVGGRFGLGDFTNLATFLARSSPPQGELEARLTELLAKAVADSSA